MVADTVSFLICLSISAKGFYFTNFLYDFSNTNVYSIELHDCGKKVSVHTYISFGFGLKPKVLNIDSFVKADYK